MQKNKIAHLILVDLTLKQGSAWNLKFRISITSVLTRDAGSYTSKFPSIALALLHAYDLMHRVIVT